MEDILHIPELRDSIFLNLNLYDLYNIRSCNKSLNQYVSDFSSYIIQLLIHKYTSITTNNIWFQFSEQLEFIDIYYYYYYIYILVHIINQKESYDEFILYLQSIQIIKTKIPNIKNLYDLMQKYLKYPFYINQNIYFNEPKQIWKKVNNKWIISKIIQPKNTPEFKTLLKYDFSLNKLDTITKFIFN